MSLGKVAVSGALGFMLGAGIMMAPSGNKLRKAVIKEADMVRRMVKKW